MFVIKPPKPLNRYRLHLYVPLRSYSTVFPLILQQAGHYPHQPVNPPQSSPPLHPMQMPSARWNQYAPVPACASLALPPVTWVPNNGGGPALAPFASMNARSFVPQPLLDFQQGCMLPSPTPVPRSRRRRRVPTGQLALQALSQIEEE